MKVTSYNPGSATLAKPSKPAETKSSPEDLKAEKSAQEANTLAQQALNQLHFAGSNPAYLQNAKYLAELAGKQSSGISQSSALYAAKGANATALQALEQAQKLEAGQGQKLNLVA